MKKKSLNIGEKAPAFKIVTADNTHFSLSSALESNRNILLVFYRGHW